MKYKIEVSAVSAAIKHHPRYCLIFDVPPITTSSYACGKEAFIKKQQKVLQTIRSAETIMAKELKSG